MKKSLAFLLSVLMIVLNIAVFTAVSAPASADTLPSAVDLQQDSDLPPIGNQGSVGCCVSMAATYMQLTNAYSRYLHMINPSITWNPSSGSAQYCFAPRFTYNLGGAATREVYHILQEQGAPTQTYAAFSGGVTGAASYNDLARNWAVSDQNCWTSAQQYRISNFDQVWAIVDDDTRPNTHQAFYTGTQSGEGAALITRIKESLNAGNVVVTGGYPDRWVTDLVTISNKGTYGKTGDKAIPYSTNVSSGGHQVSIIGYDDNITCVKNGVTLRGAFKIANSWGSWQNQGCIWMMYDALNGEGQSSYAALNVTNRIWTMDQFIFLDYRTDLNYGTPELMARVKMTTTDRDSFRFTITRTDPETGITESYTPYMFSEHSRDAYNEGYSFNGKKNSEATGYLTVNYDHFTDDLPAGKTVDDYLWGIDVTYVSTNSGRTSTVKSVELLRNGSSAYTLTNLNDTITASNGKSYILDTKRAVRSNVVPGVTIVPLSGTFAKNVGEQFAFTVNVASTLKTTNVLNVYCDGEKLPLVDGHYTLTVKDATDGNVITVEGVQSKSVKGVDLINYSFDFENNDGRFVLLFSLVKSTVAEDVCDEAAIRTGAYKYVFRCTVTDPVREETAVYDFTPCSTYDFGDSLLFRVNVADQGWFPQSGSNYRIKAEICRCGVSQYIDNLFNVSCQTAPSSNVMTSHVHVFNGATTALVTSNCITAGTGYVLCSHEGCKAKSAVTLPLDNTAHRYSGDLFLTKNATSTEPGEYSCACLDCGGTAVCEYFTAPKFDVDGDNDVSITDVGCYLNYLRGAAPYSSLACGGDFNSDGFSNIKDLTLMLIKLAS